MENLFFSKFLFEKEIRYRTKLYHNSRWSAELYTWFKDHWIFFLLFFLEKGGYIIIYSSLYPYIHLRSTFFSLSTALLNPSENRLNFIRRLFFHSKFHHFRFFILFSFFRNPIIPFHLGTSVIYVLSLIGFGVF